MLTATQKDYLKEYFAKLSLEGINLSEAQKWWYAKKYETLREDIMREYPSTPDEAFSASQEGYWYATYLKELYDTGHVTNVSLDRSIPVHTAWDLGQRDAMSIWFFQVTRSGDVNIIDFWQKENVPLEQVIILLKNKGYNYGIHLWPHDANARDRAGITFVTQARGLGFSGVVLEPHAFLDGINKTRTFLSKCWFDRNKCAEGLKMLEGYKKRWSSSFGGWTAEPVHDECSHCFLGETLILTDYGMQRIMDLPNEGKVWTNQGWKNYHTPRITRTNAELVAVKFKDGTIVKCTPDHLFRTANGWRSAANLLPDLEIQSSLGLLFNTLMESFIEFTPKKFISKMGKEDCIAWFGEALLAMFQTDVTSTIRMGMLQTIDLRIWNVFLQVCIYLMNGSKEEFEVLNLKLLKISGKLLKNGIDLPKEENGIKNTPSELKPMKDGQEVPETVLFVEAPTRGSTAKAEQAIRNIVRAIAKPPIVESVKEIKENQSVWCLTVPEVEHFSLANGAMVHNCADAFRYLCAGIDKITGSSGGLEKQAAILRNFWGG